MVGPLSVLGKRNYSLSESFGGIFSLSITVLYRLGLNRKSQRRYPPMARSPQRLEFNVKSVFLLISAIAIWLPVAQLGPDFLLLDMVADHPPCDAVIKLRVDKAGSSPSSKGNV
jgi:hypothetical protein